MLRFPGVMPPHPSALLLPFLPPATRLVLIAWLFCILDLSLMWRTVWDKAGAEDVVIWRTSAFSPLSFFNFFLRPLFCNYRILLTFFCTLKKKIWELMEIILFFCPDRIIIKDTGLTRSLLGTDATEAWRALRPSRYVVCSSEERVWEVLYSCQHMEFRLVLKDVYLYFWLDQDCDLLWFPRHVALL